MPSRAKKTGRKLLPINEEQVFKLAKIGCTNSEIADILGGCNESVIRTRFPDVLSKARGNMKRRLRFWQLKQAKAGNVTMLIWLGKQMLDQRDHHETTLTTDEVKPLTIKMLTVNTTPG